MRRPKPKRPQKPRNVAAKALREQQFRPRVEENPKAYRRRPKYQPAPAEKQGGDDAPDE